MSVSVWCRIKLMIVSIGSCQNKSSPTETVPKLVTS